MFIPRGKAIHENLATSYVQVDALVADLGEGGFSGVVEVVLRDTDTFVILNAGKVAAVVEMRGEDDRHPGNQSYTHATLEQLAERARTERGRVSIYAYAASTAGAVAGRLNARPLYIGLSTEFTDLDKMIWKLARERDREWFIEINGESARRILVHMRDGGCRILNAELAPPGETETESLDLVGNPVLAKLLDECNRGVASFDVYFRPAAEANGSAPAPTALEAAEPVLDSDSNNANDSQAEEAPAFSLGPYRSQPDDAKTASAQNMMPSPDMPRLPPDRPPSEAVRMEGSTNSRTAADAPMSTLAAEFAPLLEENSSIDVSEDPIETALALTREGGELSVPGEAVAMAEVKRLMGEIARTIEQAAQAVGPPDRFSMLLRAGQLKIADSYPFLDPFAGEIEYLAGEIVFVGHATAEEFIAGLTEALRLAVESVKRSTAYPDRFRAYVADDLRRLLSSNRAEFESFGLDRVIDQIVTL